MDLARDLARAGAERLETVWADQQTAGRGRRGRSWQSPTGAGLYFTTILDSGLQIAQLGVVPLAVGVALVEAIRLEVGLDARLKWPNDVQAPDGRKIAGILIERDAQSGKLLIGIGVNLIATEHPGVRAAALESFGSVRPERLLERILSGIDTWNERLERQDFASVLDAWRTNSATLGRTVTVLHADGSSLTGFAEGVDTTGALLVRVDDHLESVSSGEVSLRHAD